MSNLRPKLPKFPQLYSYRSTPVELDCTLILYFSPRGMPALDHSRIHPSPAESIPTFATLPPNPFTFSPFSNPPPNLPRYLPTAPLHPLFPIPTTPKSTPLPHKRKIQPFFVFARNPIPRHETPPHPSPHPFFPC